ncbi:MAG: thymidine phosphorylase [Proteobacteria bacterium]|nr:thymidine phosphorylase [Pseudomonadota bacterium]
MTTGPLIHDLIRKKRDGQTLAAGELRAFIAGVSDGSIPDYQVAAMLMAIFLRGLDDAELPVWADAMLHSGEVLDLSAIDRPTVDKHSTGGVGDKISLPLAPAVAACGAAVPMISGRGLGHTGGTLDKLEAIPGFSVDLDTERFIAQVDSVGSAIIGQTDLLAPADRRLYALRDVTATIESVPLIASSIMSKKLAEGIDGLVLDCKVGRGAFMTTREQARELGNAIRVIGEAAGKKVTVVLTAMDAPIGRYVGNALEVVETIDVLRGKSGPGLLDTRQLTVELGAEMLCLAGLVADRDRGVERIERAIDSGDALSRLSRLIEAQGGDARVVDDPGRLPRASYERVITAPSTGRVEAISALDIGRAALVMGAGRARKEDRVNPAVGIELAVSVGDRVEAGQVVARLHHDERGIDRAHAMAAGAFVIDQSAPAQPAAPAHGQSGAQSRILEMLQ